MNIMASSPIAAAAAKSLQSCLTLCNPIDGSPTGSAVLGILQARTLEWVAISFSNVWKWKVKVKSLSCVQLLATPWTAAYQGPLPMGFSRQEYWSGVPLSSPFSPITSWQIDLETMETVHEIKRHLLVGKKAVTNLDSVLKIRDTTLLTKAYIVKAMVSLVVMYGCESWTIKKAEHWRIDVSNCGAGEDSWESPGQQGDQTTWS